MQKGLGDLRATNYSLNPNLASKHPCRGVKRNKNFETIAISKLMQSGKS